MVGDLIFNDNNTTERLRGLHGAVETAQNKVGQLGQTMQLFGQNLVNIGTSLVNNVTKPIINMVETGIKYNMQLEDQTTAFEVMLGSATKAKGFVNQLTKMAAETPFESTNLADASKTLMGFGINSKQVIPIMSKLGDVSLGNQQKFKSLSLVMGQVSAAGKLQGGDLIQFINGGWNPLQEMVKMTGKSYKELRGEMEKGNISFEDVSKALDHATQKGGLFYKGMEKGSQTLSGRLSTLKDNFMQLLGQATKPLFDFISAKAIPFLSTLIESFGKMSPAVKNTGLIIAGLAAAFPPVIVTIGTVIIAISGLISIIGTIGLPIIAAVSAIGLLIAEFSLLGGAWTYILAKAGILTAAFNFIKTGINAVVSILQGKTITAFSLLTQGLGMSSDRAAKFIYAITQMRDKILLAIEVVKNVKKVLDTMITGKQTDMINLLRSKFGLTKDEAKNFANKVTDLRETVKNLATKVKEIASNQLLTFINAIKRAASFVYDHRKEIISATSAMISFATTVVKRVSQIVSTISSLVSFGKKIVSTLSSSAGGAVAAFTKIKNAAESSFNRLMGICSNVVSAFNKIGYAIGQVISKISQIKFPSPPSWIPGFAEGVTNYEGGVALVGEKGPEIVQLPRGSNVIPNQRIKDFAARVKPMQIKNLGSSQDISNVTINIHDPIYKDTMDIDKFMNRIMAILKRRGVSIRNA